MSSDVEIKHVIQLLDRRIKNVMNEKRVRCVQLMSLDSRVDGVHFEPTVANIYAKNKRHIVDMMFMTVKKDILGMEVSGINWRTYYIGLLNFNLPLGTITFGRAAIII